MLVGAAGWHTGVTVDVAVVVAVLLGLMANENTAASTVDPATAILRHLLGGLAIEMETAAIWNCCSELEAAWHGLLLGLLWAYLGLVLFLASRRCSARSIYRQQIYVTSL